MEQRHGFVALLGYKPPSCIGTTSTIARRMMWRCRIPFPSRVLFFFFGFEWGTRTGMNLIF
jgi:hypothetical protein